MARSTAGSQKRNKRTKIVTLIIRPQNKYTIAFGIKYRESKPQKHGG
jgi:hypothetical protein